MDRHQINCWRAWLHEHLGKFVNAGRVTIYHYSNLDVASVRLDPIEAAKYRHGFSRNDFAQSVVPRLYFYLDPSERETHFRRSYNLYAAEIDADQIYDPDSNTIKFDWPPDALTKEARYDYWLKKISGWREHGGFEKIDGKWVNTPKKWVRESSPYIGVYAHPPGFHEIVLFTPIDVQRISDEQRQNLEQSTNEQVTK